ncbi:pH regulation protein F [Enterococcus saccharolyticus]|nr:pH regulation protein F [Enterococcus saccharolyticus]
MDSFGITLIGFIGIVMILQDTLAYADVILVLSILSFVGTVALSKFIERGAVFDRD